jgi:hypothetical protein
MRFTYSESKTLIEKKIAVPMNSRQPNNYEPEIFLGAPFKPNPIKHWRKQLNSNYQSKSKPTINDLENPSNCIITDSANTNVMYNEIISTTKCDGSYVEGECKGGTNNIRRTSSILKPNYCSSTKQYLQKRCKTFDQNQSIGKNINDQYYKSTMCYSDDSKTKCVVYKPKYIINNYKQDECMVSSNYISRKKQNSLNINKYNPNKKLESCNACVSTYRNI